jgi:hypothetical protein
MIEATILQLSRRCPIASFSDAIDRRLANTPPTTLAGVAAVLRLANEIEDAGNEWHRYGRPQWLALPASLRPWRPRPRL